MKKHGYGLKVIIIGVLTLLFLIPIAWIKYIVKERQDYQKEAIQSIVAPIGRSPGFNDFSINVPYKYVKKAQNDAEIITDGFIHIRPDNYDIDMEISPYTLKRGIFEVPVFNGQVHIQAKFNSLDISKYHPQEALYEKTKFNIELSDTKFLTKEPKISINGQEVALGTERSIDGKLLYYLPITDPEKGITVAVTIYFQGGERINIRPVGGNNTFKVKSNWKDPSFSGAWLPTTRTVNEAGFSAEWNILGFNTKYGKDCKNSWVCEEPYHKDEVSIGIMIPVDSYKKTERAVKYALLFLIIPFLALFICEIFSKTRIHFIQYGLIGLNDVIFYLLLLSISEQIAFNLTYLICVLAICAVTLFYGMSIFKSKKWGAILSSVQLLSYIFLFGLLGAEDYALLIGSLGLFAIVCTLMFITRKIDWYGITQNKKPAQEENATKN